MLAGIYWSIHSTSVRRSVLYGSLWNSSPGWLHLLQSGPSSSTSRTWSTSWRWCRITPVWCWRTEEMVVNWWPAVVVRRRTDLLPLLTPALLWPFYEQFGSFVLYEFSSWLNTALDYRWPTNPPHFVLLCYSVMFSLETVFCLNTDWLNLNLICFELIQTSKYSEWNI